MILWLTSIPGRSGAGVLYTPDQWNVKLAQGVDLRVVWYALVSLARQLSAHVLWKMRMKRHVLCAQAVPDSTMVTESFSEPNGSMAGAITSRLVAFTSAFCWHLHETSSAYAETARYFLVPSQEVSLRVDSLSHACMRAQPAHVLHCDDERP